MKNVFKKTSFTIPKIVGLSAIIFLSLSVIGKNSFEKITVEGGIISGTTNYAADISIFKGIPFAAPPVGNLRWKAPQPVVPWSGIKKCDAFGPSPMQNTPEPFGPWSVEYLIPKQPISEDCLYLNVWTGAASAIEKRPVVLWIYGGAFVSGGSNAPIYDGEAMAKNGVIFVSANYRLGVFGFLALPELTKESTYGSSGNYALLDQLAALKWIKKNIAAFGGDPENITIAGQSAGSMSVNCLVASPLSKGLFKHAIAQSGAALIETAQRKTPTLNEAEQKGLNFTSSINANSLDELRKISAQDLQKQTWSFSSPIVDGYVLPKSIPDIFAAGEENKVDLLTGWNDDDGDSFGKPDNAEAFKKFALKKYGDNAEKFLTFYPAHNDEEAMASQKKFTRDLAAGIQNYTWANKQSELKNAKVYVYKFTRKLPATDDYIKYGAFHTGEMAYAYGNLNFVKRCPWLPADYILENTMLTYWTNFIKTGNPNGKDVMEWPAYNSKTNNIMLLDINTEAKPLPEKKALDFLIEKVRK